MTYTRDTTPLKLRVTPMQLPEATPVPQAAGQLFAGIAGQASLSPCGLQLHPGDPSELVITLENRGASPLAIALQIEGDFPLPWCYLALDTDVLAPHAQTQAVLYFLAPKEVFERGDTGPAGRLQIDYPGRIYITGSPTEEAGQPTSDLIPFTLHLRPHSEYLAYLPKLYREIDFIGRLLAIFEQSFEPMVQALDVMWAYLDPLTAPEAMLPFLAHWVAWPSDVHWSSDRQRQLIRHAVELYRWRGTRRGLQLFLHLYTDLPLDDDHIQITEFEGRGFAFQEAILGDNTHLGGGKPFHFTVRLRPDPDQSIDAALVHQVITQEKPAFCTYDLIIAT